MGITVIDRDYGNAVSIVRLTTTDALATVRATDYILNQKVNIEAANGGNFLWVVSDVVLVYASDGWELFTISSNFHSLTPFVSGTGVTLINTGSGLTGGPITTTGTISLAPIANNTFLANTSGLGAAPTAHSLPLASSLGGTGVASPTIHTLPVAQGASAFNFLGPLTNGQLLIGSTGLDPVASTLTAGSGVSISNSAGSITINASGGGMTTVNVVSNTQTIAVNTRYICNDGATLITFALPATSAVGDVFIIVGKDTGLFTMTQAANQQIFVGTASSTLGATGTVTSNTAKCSIRLVCITANLVWSTDGCMPAGAFTFV